MVGSCFSDVSPVLLERCRDAARALGLIDRARFVVARAEDLAGIADASVDVLTTRSVLIYVAEKPQAFTAFARVLRPKGGRLSLFEPINRLMFPEPADRFHGYEIASVADLAAKVKAQFPADGDDRAAMMGFDDRDLLDLTVAAGFARVRVECHLGVQPGGLMMPVEFDALLDSAPNPNAAACPRGSQCRSQRLEINSGFSPSFARRLTRTRAVRRNGWRLRIRADRRAAGSAQRARDVQSATDSRTVASASARLRASRSPTLSGHLKSRLAIESGRPP